MNTYLRTFARAALVATFSVAAVAAISTVTANTGPAPTSVKLLTATFDARPVAQVDVGDFHFRPGQIAPVHTHDAPAVGYVAKGMIIYQVEGEAPRILRAGDAFYEPAGPRILRFDNASATDEAVFIDFNLQRSGEPFIVFEAPPTEAIDRRALPSVNLGGKSVDTVDVFATDIPRRGELTLNAHVPTLGIVAEGIVEIRVPGKPVQRVIAGKSFNVPASADPAVITNASAEIAARVITYRLR